MYNFALNYMSIAYAQFCLLASTGLSVSVLCGNNRTQIALIQVTDNDPLAFAVWRSHPHCQVALGDQPAFACKPCNRIPSRATSLVRHTAA